MVLCWFLDEFHRSTITIHDWGNKGERSFVDPQILADNPVENFMPLYTDVVL